MPPRVTRTGTSTPRGVGGTDYAAPRPLGQVPKPVGYSLTDVGELAARLGSIVTFDRRGDVIWMDDFEDNINKWTILAAAGGTAGLSAFTAQRGALSAFLTVGAAVGRVTSMITYLPYLERSKVGYEISFTEDQSLSLYQWNLCLWRVDRQYVGRVRLVPGIPSVLSIDDDTAGWVILDANITLNALGFNTLKLVIDPQIDPITGLALAAPGNFTRLLLNDRTYDISSYLLSTGGGLATNTIAIYLTITNGVAIAQTIYVDDCIITQNEPDNITL